MLSAMGYVGSLSPDISWSFSIRSGAAKLTLRTKGDESFARYSVPLTAASHPHGAARQEGISPDCAIVISQMRSLPPVCAHRAKLCEPPALKEVMRALL
jgi:hypothetical protein